MISLCSCDNGKESDFNSVASDTLSDTVTSPKTDTETEPVTTTAPEIVTEEVTTTYEEIELVDFVPPKSKKYNFSVDWDNDELTDLFSLAYDISMNYLYGSTGLYTSQGTIEYKNKEYNRSGIKYDSFIEYLETAFTQHYIYDISRRFNENYIEYNDEVICKNTDRGSNIAFDEIKFSLLSETDDVIIVQGNARYCHEDSPDVEWFENYYYIIKKTKNGLRFDYYENWN